MKIGMIFECGPDGADKKVCEHLARRLSPDIETSSVTLDNKPELISECGNTAASLLSEGCERIVIVWDLYPPRRGKGDKPCRKEDRENIAKSLLEAGVTSPNVYLVCIEEELETWLLADGRAISQYLSTTAHKVKVKDRKNVERVKNPKGELRKLFKGVGKDYIDTIHAHKIIKELPDLTKIKKCATFIRFAVKATGINP
jgi:hypothetical protein